MRAIEFEWTKFYIKRREIIIIVLHYSITAATKRRLIQTIFENIQLSIHEHD